MFAAMALSGCAIVDDTSTTESNVITHNRLAANRLAANRLAANRLAANRLGTQQLSNGSSSLSDEAADLLATSDGRDVLNYLISCALPSGTSLIASDGTEFDGEIGVAPGWLDNNLDASGQRWVSACVFARVSDLDVAVPISLRGPSPALQADPSEIADWTIQQGAFYGLLFTGKNSSGPDWVACSGSDLADAEAADRICASPDPANPGFTKCGFAYAGPCSTARNDHGHHRGNASDTPTACHDFNSKGTYFEGCSGWTGPRMSGPGTHASSGDFSEVVTVYVHP
jgi:hypothetical protein